MTRTEAFVSLRDRGAKLEPSKTCEFTHIVTMPNGQVYEVWSSSIVDFAQTITF